MNQVVPSVAPTTGKGGQPAFCSVWDIHSYYGESYIVQGVSFDIREGEIVALLGRNGAGKTSTLRTLARVDDPALRHGEIWLDHKPLHTMSAYEAAQNGLVAAAGHDDIAGILWVPAAQTWIYGLDQQKIAIGVVIIDEAVVADDDVGTSAGEDGVDVYPTENFTVAAGGGDEVFAAGAGVGVRGTHIG